MKKNNIITIRIDKIAEIAPTLKWDQLIAILKLLQVNYTFTIKYSKKRKARRLKSPGLKN